MGADTGRTVSDQPFPKRPELINDVPMTGITTALRALTAAAATLLALTHNGEPLTPEHGAPLRLIVPSEEGARGVKWLAEIKLLAYPLTNNLQTRFCNIIK